MPLAALESRKKINENKTRLLRRKLQQAWQELLDRSRQSQLRSYCGRQVVAIEDLFYDSLRTPPRSI